MPSFKSALLMSCGLWFTATLLPAQETRGQILGRITDPSGAVVAGAEVKAVNTATSIVATTRTNGSGDYAFHLLISGTYNVSAELTGFKVFLQQGISLQVAENKTVNVVLEVGQTSDRVVVVG